MKTEKNHFPAIMKSVAAVTSVITAVLMLLYFRFRQDEILSAVITTGTTAYHFLMRLAVGFVVPRATDGYRFDFRHPWFQPREWEPGLYRRLQLKRWKGNLPTYAPEQFSLERHPPEQVIRNMCGAEIVHEIIMALSFLPLLTVPVFGAFPVFLITSLLAALYDSVFVMAQRYNRPRLIRIYEKKEGRRP